jgi:hypothetical protein
MMHMATSHVPLVAATAPMNADLCGRARIVVLRVVGAVATRAVCRVTTCRDAQLRLVVDVCLSVDLD